MTSPPQTAATAAAARPQTLASRQGLVAFYGRRANGLRALCDALLAPDGPPGGTLMCVDPGDDVRKAACEEARVADPGDAVAEVYALAEMSARVARALDCGDYLGADDPACWIQRLTGAHSGGCLRQLAARLRRDGHPRDEALARALEALLDEECP